MHRKKLFIVIVLIFILGGYWFYIKPTSLATSQPTIVPNVQNTSNPETDFKLSSKSTAPKAIKEPDIDLDDLNELDKTSSHTSQKTESAWSPYIDSDSDEYNDILKKSMSSEGPIVVGENIYFKLLIDGQIVFSKITKSEAESVLYDSFGVYGELIEDLNDLADHGEWSYEAEKIVRAIFRKNFTYSAYSINAMQCKEKTCVLELTYSSVGAADKFTNLLRYNRDLCDCVVGEYIWAEEMRAVFKIILS